ncbi:MAG: hypothetical protein ACOZCO_10415 [Bacteroidota bacterium]
MQIKPTKADYSPCWFASHFLLKQKTYACHAFCPTLCGSHAAPTVLHAPHTMFFIGYDIFIVCGAYNPDAASLLGAPALSLGLRVLTFLIFLKEKPLLRPADSRG